MAPTINNQRDGWAIARDEWKRMLDLHPQLTDTYDLVINTRLTRALGRCCYPTWRRGGRIEMSRAILKSTEYHIRQTVIHETAHALTCGAGHGPAWIAKARELGYEGDRLFTDRESLPAPALVARCDACGFHYFRSRRPRKLTGCWCGNHGLRFVDNTAKLRPNNNRHPAHGRRRMIDRTAMLNQWKLAVSRDGWGLANPEAIGNPTPAPAPAPVVVTTAQITEAIEDQDNEVAKLLNELRDRPDKRRQQQIRRRLRALGHRGGLRG